MEGLKKMLLQIFLSSWPNSYGTVKRMICPERTLKLITSKIREMNPKSGNPCKINVCVNNIVHSVPWKIQHLSGQRERVYRF